MLEKIQQVTGKAVYVSGDDIDTDRIIPARYLKCVTFDDLAEGLFADVRTDSNGNTTDHPLNDPNRADAKIMISDANFGCGSSREHAPQSIYRSGFRAVIAESFAEIFYGNSITLGMPCIEASKEQIEEIAAAVTADAETIVDINVAEKTITVNGKSYAVTIKDSAHDALVNGRWDPLAELLEANDTVDSVAATLAYM